MSKIINHTKMKNVNVNFLIWRYPKICEGRGVLETSGFFYVIKNPLFRQLNRFAII